MKEKKYILFDLDGTLTDPKEGITKAVQYSLAHYGIEETNLDMLCPFIGPPLRDSYINFYGFPRKRPQRPFPCIVSISAGRAGRRIRCIREYQSFWEH